MNDNQKQYKKEMLFFGFGFVAMAYVQSTDYSFMFLPPKEDGKVVHVNAPKKLSCRR